MEHCERIRELYMCSINLSWHFLSMSSSSRGDGEVGSWLFISSNSLKSMLRSVS